MGHSIREHSAALYSELPSAMNQLVALWSTTHDQQRAAVQRSKRSQQVCDSLLGDEAPNITDDWTSKTESLTQVGLVSWRKAGDIDAHLRQHGHWLLKAAASKGVRGRLRPGDGRVGAGQRCLFTMAVHDAPPPVPALVEVLPREEHQLRIRYHTAAQSTDLSGHYAGGLFLQVNEMRPEVGKAPIQTQIEMPVLVPGGHNREPTQPVPIRRLVRRSGPSATLAPPARCDEKDLQPVPFRAESRELGPIAGHYRRVGNH